LGLQDTEDEERILDIPIQGVEMTHFNNLDEREIFDAILLLKDDEREWSTELEAIRRNLARLLERIMQVEWHYLEPEIGDLALNLLKETERETNARRTNTTGEEIILQSENYLRVAGQQRPIHTCRCAGK
jgi:regulator of replication initiation timing